MNQTDFENHQDEEDQKQEGNKLVYGIEMSLRAGEKKHNEFVERHKAKSNGSIDGFYKVYCFENDFEENKLVEKYWKHINRNINNLYEFKHLTALKVRAKEEIVDILKTEAVTDILIESNLLEREQFLSLIKLGKSIYHGFIGDYLKSVTFFVSNTDLFLQEIYDMMGTDTDANEGFRLLCKKIEVRIVEHFDKNQQRILKKSEDE